MRYRNRYDTVRYGTIYSPIHYMRVRRRRRRRRQQKKNEIYIPIIILCMHRSKRITHRTFNQKKRSEHNVNHTYIIITPPPARPPCDKTKDTHITHTYHVLTKKSEFELNHSFRDFLYLIKQKNCIHNIFIIIIILTNKENCYRKAEK